MAELASRSIWNPFRATRPVAAGFVERFTADRGGIEGDRDVSEQRADRTPPASWVELENWRYDPFCEVVFANNDQRSVADIRGRGYFRGQGLSEEQVTAKVNEIGRLIASVPQMAQQLRMLLADMQGIEDCIPYLLSEDTEVRDEAIKTIRESCRPAEGHCIPLADTIPPAGDEGDQS